jgi:MOSC domain-containing protein YiiM
VHHRGKAVSTGIFKEPVSDRVMLRQLNLDGDEQADLRGHGGIYKAAYAYSIENHEYWQRELGRDDFGPGQFGENFTVEGMTDDVVHVGDMFKIGGAVVEVTQPRVPCFKLGIKMGIDGFERRFWRASAWDSTSGFSKKGRSARAMFSSCYVQTRSG